MIVIMHVEAHVECFYISKRLDSDKINRIFETEAITTVRCEDYSLLDSMFAHNVTQLMLGGDELYNC